MSKANPICRICDVELNDENWSPSYRKSNSRICKRCNRKQTALWQKSNPDKVKAIRVRYERKQGHRSFKEYRECSMFLGVHVAERVLRHVFKGVEMMPMNNIGYDFICNNDKLIDVKSACISTQGNWMFNIRHNDIADYFLCLAFDNRKDLNPLHAWLLPGCKFKHIACTGIRPSTLHRWNKYKLDIEKVSACCDVIRCDKNGK